jgi:hypothetical protein
MEELVWSNSFEIGYQKHPPLPTWILYPFTMVFGKSMWLPFALGVTCVAFAQVISFYLYQRIAKNASFSNPKAFGVLAVLVASPLIYYTVRGGDFNHNEAQLWSIAAMYYFYYRSWEKERGLALDSNQFWQSWLLLGVVIGFAIISKYSAVIQVLVLLVHFFWSGRWRQVSNRWGILVAFVGCLLIAGPHLWWLYHQTALGQGPLFYVTRSMSVKGTYLESVLEIFNQFLFTQILRILPCLFVVYLIFKMSKNSSRSAAHQTSWWSKIGTQDQQFLLFAAMGPMVIAMLIGLLFDQKIEAKWAVTFFIMIGFIGLFFAKEGLKYQLLIKRVLLGHLVIGLLYSVLTGPVANQLGIQGRSNFPSKAFAQSVQKHWDEHPELTQGKPIRLIIGDTWIIGNVIIHDPNNGGRDIKPWIDGNDLSSPWLKPEDKNQPALILIDYVPMPKGKVWRAGHPASPQVQELFDQATEKGVDSVPWTSKKDAPPLEYQWAILPNIKP